MTDIIEDDENIHVPKIPLTEEEIERREMYHLACSNPNLEAQSKPPVSAYEVFQALQVNNHI